MRVKRIIALALISTLVLGICGCSCSKSDGTHTPSKNAGYDPLDYVELGDYEGVTIEINKSDYELTDDKIASKMLDMCNSDVTYEADPDKTVVEADSIVNVDYVGKLNGVPFDGGAAKDIWIDVAGNCDAESDTSYIDGFTNGVIGARVGTTADYDVTFPTNYGSSELAGKEVTFSFTINSIAKDKEDELSDDYVKAHSTYDSVSALRSATTEELETELAANRESDIRSKVRSAVLAVCTVKSLPDDVVTKQVDDYMKYYEKRYAGSSGSGSLEQVIQSNYGLSLDEFKEQVKSEYESQFKIQIVFEAIAKDKNMKIDKDEFEEYCNDKMTENGFSSLDDYFEYNSSTGDDAKAGKAYMQQIYLCNEALDYCVSKAVINEV